MGGKKKIAYLTYSISSQRNRTQYQRAKYLSEKNSLFLFLRKSSRVPQEIKDRVTIIERKTATNPIFSFLWRVYKVWSINRKTRFDFVYTFYLPYSIIEGFVLKLVGFKWIADIWDHPELLSEISGKNYLHWLKERLIIVLAKKFLRCADMIICAIMPGALKDYDIHPEKIVSVTNGVDLQYIQPKGIKNDSKFFKIFYVGFVYKIRGIDTLVKATYILDKKYGVPTKLILTGKSNSETEMWISDFISKHDLENTIELTGELEHEKVLALIEDADVCVFPFPRKKELEYIYPIKVFEYLAMGKVVVATNLKGVSQIIKNRVNGLLVEPNNPEEMAKAILEIYTNNKLRKKLEHNARKTALKYEWSMIHEKIDNSLNKLVEKEG